MKTIDHLHPLFAAGALIFSTAVAAKPPAPAPAPAPPAANYCVPGPNSFGLSLSDVTLNSSNSTDCFGVVADNEFVGGSATGWSVNTVVTGGLFGSSYGGGLWGSYIKDNNTGSGSTQSSVLSGIFSGFTWSLDGINGAPGTWALGVQDTNGFAPPNLPLTTDLLVLLKASNSWSAFLFDNVDLGSGNNGTFLISWDATPGAGNGFSHMTVYLRNGAGCEINCEPPPPPPPPGSVPEPGSLALVALGALGFGALRRRKKLLDPNLGDN